MPGRVYPQPPGVDGVVPGTGARHIEEDDDVGARV